jgi:hypothetical protein
MTMMSELNIHLNLVASMDLPSSGRVDRVLFFISSNYWGRM